MLTDLEGRFSERPGIVASPCGFYVIRSEPGSAAQALLLGRDLGWTQPGRDQLLSVDSIVLDVGLVDATSMGAPDVRDEALLVLHGQWELAWLVRETGHASIPVRDAGSGKAHLPPHPPWRTWSVTLPEPLESDAGAFRHAVIGSVALGSRVLAIRALLPDETLAQRALKRVIFALDSLDQKDVSIDRTAFLASVEAAAQRDRTCRAVHDVYGAALE